MKTSVRAMVNGELIELPSVGGKSAKTPTEPDFNIIPLGRNRYDVCYGNSHHMVYVREQTDGGYEIWVGRYRLSVSIRDEREERLSAYIRSSQVMSSDSVVRAPMPGLVKEVAVSRGDTVVKGQRLLILEAMKMENEITSPIDGTVKECRFTPGKNVEKDQELVHISPSHAEQER